MARNAKEYARADIPRLFALARERSADRPELARRYVTLARKIASRTRAPLRAYNRVHCRTCCAYFTSSTLRVRTRATHVVYTCLSCNAVRRYRKDS